MEKMTSKQRLEASEPSVLHKSARRVFQAEGQSGTSSKAEEYLGHPRPEGHQGTGSEPSRNAVVGKEVTVEAGLEAEQRRPSRPL